MPKQNWKDAPPIPRRLTEEKLNALGTPAETWLDAFNYCTTVGYDIEPPPQIQTEQLAKLRAANDRPAINRFHHLGHFAEHELEVRCMARWQGMRKWAALPSAIEIREQALAEAETQARQEAISRRAVEIIGEQERASFDKRKQAALRQAEKELA